jgi:hypothetical protein
VDILGINPIQVGEGHLSHIKYWDTSLSLLGCKGYLSPKTFEHMTWHYSHDTDDGVMVHSSNGEAWI